MSDDMISRKVVRQAIYDTYFNTFGGDERDQDDLLAADEFCRAVFALIDGSGGGE